MPKKIVKNTWGQWEINRSILWMKIRVKTYRGGEEIGNPNLILQLKRWRPKRKRSEREREMENANWRRGRERERDLKRRSERFLGFVRVGTFRRADGRPDNRWLRSFEQRALASTSRSGCSTRSPSRSKRSPRSSPTPLSPFLSFSLLLSTARWDFLLLIYFATKSGSSHLKLKSWI